MDLVSMSRARQQAAAGRWRLPIPSSILLSALYAGLHFIVWTEEIVTHVGWETTVYSADGSVTGVSLLTGVLLLAFLGLDYRRWRREHAPWRRHGAFVYGCAAVLVGAVVVFLLRTVSLA